MKAIERIDRYTADMDEAGFLNSESVQDAVIRNIEIFSEAEANLMLKLGSSSDAWKAYEKGKLRKDGTVVK